MIQYNKENIKVFQSSLYMTTSAVIELDDAIIITDPNWLPLEVEKIKAYVNEIRKDKQLYIIYTHSDFDHIIGSGAFPNAKVIASQKLSESKYKEDAMKQVQEFDQRYYIERNYKPVFPVVDYIISEDGQTLELGAGLLTFYLAPGHTSDGLFTVVEPLGIFLSGDYLSDVEFPFIFDSYLGYLETMRKTRKIYSEHAISVHVPGHGHTTDDKQEMENRLMFSQTYLEELLIEPENMEEALNKKFIFFSNMKDIHTGNKKLALIEMNQVGK